LKIRARCKSSPSPFAAINQAAKNFAEVVLQNCLRGADRAKAIEMIQDARMVANRSIAVNGLSIS
jgi:hypothetical protein